MKCLDGLTDDQLATLTAPEMTVLRLLAWRMWKGTCNPSVHTIARQTRLGLKTVRKALERLQAKGWIRAKSKNKLRITSWELCYAAPEDNAPQGTRVENRPSLLRKLGSNSPPTRVENDPKLGSKTTPNRERESNRYPDTAKMPSGKPGKSLAQMMAEAGLSPIPGITPP